MRYSVRQSPNTFGTSHYNRCENVAVGLFSVFLIIYSIAVGIYECYMGGLAAHIVANYYDYSASINGTNVRVSINALPRDIYSNTKTSAEVMITCGALGVIAAVIGTVYAAYVRSKSMFAGGAFLSNLIVILPPFCYCAFLTWKLHSLSDEDKYTWNSINSGFVDNLNRAEKLMICTSVFGVFWIIVAIIIWIARLRKY